MSKWKWIRHEGTYLRDVGVASDGTLHNPHGYPEDVVRAAIAEAEARAKERRRAGARKAVATRRARTEFLYYDTARRLIAGEVFGPATHCRICGRHFSDPHSVQRGVGPECWQPLTALCSVIRARGDEEGFDWLEAVRGLLRPAGGGTAEDARPQIAPDDGTSPGQPRRTPEQLALDHVADEQDPQDSALNSLMQHPYVQWYLGQHEGAVARYPAGADPDCIVMEGVHALCRHLAEMRDELDDYLAPRIITRNDQFAVLLQLSDAIGEAIDDLLEIGWPVERGDGLVVWQFDDSRPVTRADAAAEVAAIEQLRREARAS